MKKDQQGRSVIAILVLAMFGGFTLICVTRIVPVYIEHIYVEDALRHISVVNKDFSLVDRYDINRQLSNFARINSIDSIQAESFDVRRQDGRFIVDSIYEIRVPIISNIDAVISFKSQLDTANPSECCQYKVEPWSDEEN